MTLSCPVPDHGVIRAEEYFLLKRVSEIEEVVLYYELWTDSSAYEMCACRQVVCYL